MSKFVVAILVCFVTLHLHAQQPPPENKKRTIPQRTEIGKGKPRLFSPATSSSARKKNAGSIGPNLSSVLNKAFDNAKPGDTLLIPSNSQKPLQAVVMANVKKNLSVSVMNLKVINYQNAFMRLLRTDSAGTRLFKGFVHHPQYSDALTLQSKSGSMSFVAVEQNNLINE